MLPFRCVKQESKKSDALAGFALESFKKPSNSRTQGLLDMYGKCSPGSIVSGHVVRGDRFGTSPKSVDRQGLEKAAQSTENGH